jgi:hypothetical protein
MIIISGTLKSTPLPWLPVLTNIPPPHIRREDFLRREWEKYTKTPSIPLYDDIKKSTTVEIEVTKSWLAG